MNLDRKLFLGGRLKRLRTTLNLSQTQMANDLNVSSSYLNHLERNQRPLTAQVLLRLASTYDIDLRSFTSELDPSGESDMAAVFSDPIFHDLKIPKREISDLIAAAPSVAEAILKLYRAYNDNKSRVNLGANLNDAENAIITPNDWVHDVIQQKGNFFPELDAFGEELFVGLGADSNNLLGEAQKRLLTNHTISVRFVPSSTMNHYQRRFDLHRRRLYLSDILPPQSRLFAIIYQTVLSEFEVQIDSIIAKMGAPSAEAEKLMKVYLLNYLTAATIMPYDGFLAAAKANFYDIDLLKAPFGVSYEQVAHRLTTLSRPGERGVPFFMIRIDNAGNISKRFASVKFPFSRLGGTCPRWNIHQAFQNHGQTLTQIIETPQKERFFTISRAIERPQSSWADAQMSGHAIGLGCELKFANEIVYSKGIDIQNAAAVETGPMCRLCERANCKERTSAPIMHSLKIDKWVKTNSAFPF